MSRFHFFSFSFFFLMSIDVDRKRREVCSRATRSCMYAKTELKYDSYRLPSFLFFFLSFDKVTT